MASEQNETGVLAGDERMLIDGELRHTASGATFDVIHPASEQVVGQATDGTVADMDAAVGAARRAFDAGRWSGDVEFRKHCLMQLHDAMERNQERLRRILITEVGCPVTVTGSQIEAPIHEIAHWAEFGGSFDYLRDNGVHETPLGPAKRKLRYEPQGVVGAITPWNVPLYLNVAETVPALMAGNTVVLFQAFDACGNGRGRTMTVTVNTCVNVMNAVVDADAIPTRTGRAAACGFTTDAAHSGCRCVGGGFALKRDVLGREAECIPLTCGFETVALGMRFLDPRNAAVEVVKIWINPHHIHPG